MKRDGCVTLGEHGVYPLYEELDEFEAFLKAHVARIKLIGDLRCEHHMLVAFLAGKAVIALEPPSDHEEVAAEVAAAALLTKECLAGAPDDGPAFNPMERIG